MVPSLIFEDPGVMWSLGHQAVPKYAAPAWDQPAGKAVRKQLACQLHQICTSVGEEQVRGTCNLSHQRAEEAQRDQARAGVQLGAAGDGVKTEINGKMSYQHVPQHFSAGL